MLKIKLNISKSVPPPGSLGLPTTQVPKPLNHILDFFLCTLNPAIRILSIKCPKYF